MARRRRRRTPPVRHYTGVVIDVISGRRVVLQVNRREITVKYVSGFSPVIGHTVRVEKHKGKWAATGPKSDDTVTIPAGDDAPNLPTSGKHGPLRPIYTGTWTGSRWIVGDAHQGTRDAVAQIGCAFYGTGPRVLLRGPSTVARLVLRGATDRDVGPVLVFPIAEPSRPTDAPTIIGTTPVATVNLLGTDRVVATITTTDELTSGDWGGFAVYDPTETGTRAVGTQADSLTLTMDWSS